MNRDKNSIKVRSLGKTNIKVTPIGQGVMQFMGGTRMGSFMFPPMSDHESNEIVKAGLDNGINWFDTAEMYGFGKSERKLSAGLQAANIKDEDVIVATKWFPFFRWSGSIKKTISKRIENLQPYNIDLHQIHMPYSFASLKAQLNAMADLLEDGKIRSIGVSNFSAKKLRKTYEILEEKGIPLASNQVNYSLINRKIEGNGVLETAKELGVTIICWGPLQSGILTGKYHNERDLLKNLPRFKKRRISRQLKKTQKLVDELNSIAQNHEATISQIVLSWLVNYHGETVVAIPGASKVKHAIENGQAMNVNLSQEELTSLAEFSEEFL
ncbi:MAG: aldo/keto reductase [Candidatus Hodarchaeales archaeon]|jgi:aryl-alcohol dehydrogenase-like predicted oxidoreductase